MTEVERIAKGLSEAQRRVIRHSQFSEFLGVWSVRPSRRRPFFERLGLTRHIWASDIGEYDRLTPLGLQVRAYLEKETTHVSN